MGPKMMHCKLSKICKTKQNPQSNKSGYNFLTHPVCELESIYIIPKRIFSSPNPDNKALSEQSVKGEADKKLY